MQIRGILTSAACVLSVAATGFVPQADGGQLIGDWNYASDSVTDNSGGAVYQYGGLAFRQNGNTAYFAISSGTPLNGVSESRATDGRIDHGDLFINFSAHNLDTAAEYTDPGVFAVRFASGNDSLGGNNSTVGVFGSVTAVSTAGQNLGYSSINSYLAGHTYVPQMGDFQTATDVRNYFGGTEPIRGNLSAGTLLGGISSLTQADLTGLGLVVSNFPTINPQHVFGFSLDTSLLAFGTFTASLFLECGNDGVALNGEIVPGGGGNNSPAPEPSSIALLGLGIAGSWGGLRRRVSPKTA